MPLFKLRIDVPDLQAGRTASDAIEAQLDPAPLAVTLFEACLPRFVVEAYYDRAPRLDEIERRSPALVCVSHVPPPALAPIRYLCKRIVERHPDLPVIAALWTLENGDKRNDLRLPREGRILLATSLAQARAHALELLHGARLAPERSAPAEPSGRTRSIGTDPAVPREA